MSSNLKVPFSRGVNITKWFETHSVSEIEFDKYSEQDFINVKSLGADVIRLPIAFHNYTTDDKHTLDPVLLKYIDAAIDWAEKLKLFLIIDNHSFHPINATDPNIDKILIPVWEQLARRYKDKSDFVIYEVLNEPHKIPDERWGEIQGAVIEAIRKIDQKHTIIVGGTNFNSIDKMYTIPKYTDNNLIYTFHFYDPHIFTHQGATWNKPSLVPLSDLAFPFNKNDKIEIHETFKGTWVEDCLNNYENDSKLEKLNASLDKAAAFAKERDVPIFCGEFGVYMMQSPNESRVKWYEFVCAALEKRNISWTCWDYFGGFGLFKTFRGGIFPEDLNKDVVKAMGFIC
jgi:endoglucanase